MQKKEIEKVYIEKINQLKKYDEAYFKYDNPIIKGIKITDYDNGVIEFKITNNTASSSMLDFDIHSKKKSEYLMEIY